MNALDLDIKAQDKTIKELLDEVNEELSKAMITLKAGPKRPENMFIVCPTCKGTGNVGKRLLFFEKECPRCYGTKQIFNPEYGEISSLISQYVNGVIEPLLARKRVLENLI